MQNINVKLPALVFFFHSLHSETAVLDLLEAKISRLERQVYGDTKPENVSEPLIKTLHGVNTMVNAASNSHQNVQAVYKRLPELNMYLTEETLLDPSAEFERKLSLLLALNEDFAFKAKKLEEIAQLQSSLDKQSLHRYVKLSVFKFFRYGFIYSVNELKPLLGEILDSYLALNNRINDEDSMGCVVASGQQLVEEVSKSLQATNTALCQLEISKQSK